MGFEHVEALAGEDQTNGGANGAIIVDDKNLHQGFEGGPVMNYALARMAKDDKDSSAVALGSN